MNECKTISVPEAGRILGIGVNAAYAAANDGTIPTLKIGRLKRVPIAALNRMLEQAGQEEKALAPYRSAPADTEKKDDDARARNLLTRVCEILRVDFQANPNCITWPRQIEEMLRDGLTETEIIKATEIARMRGTLNLQYVRAIAINPPKENPYDRAHASTRTREKPNRLNQRFKGIMDFVGAVESTPGENVGAGTRPTANSVPSGHVPISSSQDDHAAGTGVATRASGSHLLPVAGPQPESNETEIPDFLRRAPQRDGGVGT